MTARSRNFFIFILLGIISLGNADAQVLTTAETGGKGNQAVFFSTISTPIDERNDASTVLMTPALVVSRPFKIKKTGVTLAKKME